MVLLNCEVTSEDKSCDLDLLICWRKCTHTSQEIKYSLYFIVKPESCGAWVCWHRYLEPKSFVSCYFPWMTCPQKTTCCKILYYPLRYCNRWESHSAKSNFLLNWCKGTATVFQQFCLRPEILPAALFQYTPKISLFAWSLSWKFFLPQAPLGPPSCHFSCHSLIKHTISRAKNVA